MLKRFLCRYRMIFLALVGGVAICVVDAALDWLVFYEGSFFELFVTDIPPHELYIRSVIFLIILAFGYFAHVQVTRREQLNQELQQAVADKEALLKEVHHRIKNNLGVILSLVEMQRESVKDAAARDTLNQVRLRLDAITLIHKQIYSQETFAKLRLDTYLRNLTHGLIALFKDDFRHINILMELDPVEVSPKDAVPCGLVCNELLTNAYKHAYSNGNSGEVNVRLTALPEGYELQVCDNGVGFPDDFTIAKSNCLGLQLVKSLTRQLDGSLDLKNNEGACVTMRVRKS